MDYWVIKLDSIHNIEWQKSFGGSNVDNGLSIQQTNDGGYIAAGFSNSNDGDVTGNHGGYDFWIIRLDSLGDLSWQKSLGGSADDYGLTIQQTFDGGFIAAGSSLSNNGDVTGNNGGSDMWIVKLDDTGNITWDKTLGGSLEDNAYSIQQTLDSGYIVVGNSNSTDGDVSGSNGDYDYCLFKLTSIGNISCKILMVDGSRSGPASSCATGCSPARRWRGRLGTPAAPIANWSLRNRSLRLVGEKASGMHRDAPMPRFAGRTLPALGAQARDARRPRAAWPSSTAAARTTTSRAWAR